MTMKIRKFNDLKITVFIPMERKLKDNYDFNFRLIFW